MVNKNKQTILDFLFLHPDKFFPINELWEELKDKVEFTGKTPKATFGSYIGTLFKNNMVSRKKLGKVYVYKHKKTSSEKPYKEEIDNSPMSSTANSDNSEEKTDDNLNMLTALKEKKIYLKPGQKLWCIRYYNFMGNTFLYIMINYTLNGQNIVYNPLSTDRRHSMRNTFTKFINDINNEDYIIVPDNVNMNLFYMSQVSDDNSRYFRDMFLKTVHVNNNLTDIFQLRNTVPNNYLTDPNLDINDLLLNYKHTSTYKRIFIDGTKPRDNFPQGFFNEIHNENMKTIFLYKYHF